MRRCRPSGWTASRPASCCTPAPNARIGVTLFANRLTDAIANVTLGQGPGIFPGVGFVAAGGAFRQRQNVDAIESRGIEIDASLSLGPFRLAAGYSFADAEVVRRPARPRRSTDGAPRRRRATLSPPASPGRARAAPCLGRPALRLRPV